MRKSLSVVVPAYNEEANVSKCIRNVYAVLKKTDWDFEIIIVNDGSRDKTSEVAKEEIKKLKIKQARVLDNHPNRGYGGSLKRGFDDATKDFITFAHADNQFDFAQIHELFKVQEETDADIVAGIRPEGGNDPVFRKFLRWGWNTLVRAAFGYLATDIDCGFKLFRRSILEKVTLTSNGAMIDTQLFAGARARNMKIVEIPVKHLPRTAGKSTGGDPKVALKALRELLVFWWRLKQELMVERGKALFRWEAVVLIFIIILAAALRLYRIQDYMTFLGDEGRDAVIVRDLLLGNNFPLIGPGTSVGNMYLGPWYYYFMAVPLALANFSPVGPSVMVVIFGLLTVFLLWWFARQLIHRVPALLVTLLYAVSPVVIYYSRSSWNPNIMPFFALLTIYGLWKVWKFGYWRWVVISFASFAIVLNSHYLGLLLAPVFAFFVLVSAKNRGWWKYLLAGVAAFAVIMLPLVIFDWAHNWVNLQSVRQFFTDRQATVNLKVYKAFPNLWPIWQQINTSLLGAGQMFAGQIIAWMLPLLALLSVRDRKIRRDLLVISIWPLAGLIGLGLYKQHIYDHYFGFLFPSLFLLLGFGADALYKSRPGKFVIIIVFTALLTLSAIYSPLRNQPNQQLSRTRQLADFIQRESGGEPFNLALLSKRNYDMSYRYFLYLNGAPYRTIHQELTDQLFVICEEPECHPINNPLWEIAGFGWSKIERQWQFPWGVEVLKLVHNEDTQTD